MLSSIKKIPISALFYNAIASCQLCGGRCIEADSRLKIDDANGYSSRHLCRFCFEDLPRFNPQLNSLNLLTWPSISALFEKRQFDQLFAVAPYIWPFNHWITQFKYLQKFELANLLAELMYFHWQQDAQTFQPLALHLSDGSTTNETQRPIPDLVLSVPIHIQRWQERGFNQSHLIAKPFAQRHGYHYSDDFLIRTKHTEKQVGQNGSARRKRLIDAFALSDNAITHLENNAVQNVLLIDDVITTGATVNEISRLLKAYGVQQVTVATICIALPIEKGS